MLFLSLLAFLQMFVLPGFVFISVFHPRKNYFFQTVFLIFVFSLFINYALVSAFIHFGIYSKNVLLILITIEFVLLACFQIFSVDLKLERNCIDFSKNLDSIFVISVFFILFCYVSSVLEQVPKIFSAWDDVVSWNCWASEFAHGVIPVHVDHYPQALPVQWSLSYVLYGCDLEYLPKATVPLYLYSAVAAICERGSVKKSFFSIITAILILFLYNNTGYVNAGYVDIPCSIVSFSAVFFLGVSIEEDDENLFMISALLAILSGLVKQSGLLVFVFYPIVAMLFWFKKAKVEKKIVFILCYLLVFVCTTGLFYLFVQKNIIEQNNNSEIAWVTSGIYNGVPFYARFLPALKNFFFSIRFFLFPCIVFVFVQKNKFAKMVGLIGILYLFVWACFYSYDLRNGFLAWPFIIYSEMCGLEEFVKTELFKNLYGKIRFIFDFLLSKKGCVIVLVVIFLASLIGGKKFTKEFLIAKQEAAKIHRGGDIGRFVDNFFESSESDTLYLSNNQPLNWTADNSFSKRNYVGYSFYDLEALKQKLLSSHIKYICPNYSDCSPAVIDYFEEKIQEGVFKVLYKHDPVKFIYVEDFSKL